MSAPRKTAPKKAPAHPPFQDMIKEAILQDTEGPAKGISRPAIKKYIAAKYKLDAENKTVSHNIAAAIVRGEKTGAFTLPKGLSGKVKLSAKGKAEAKKAAAPPKPAVAKPVAKTVAAKKKPVEGGKKASAATAKKPIKKPAMKKTSSTTASAKKPAAKKAGTKAAPKKTTTTKKAAAKK